MMFLDGVRIAERKTTMAPYINQSINLFVQKCLLIYELNELFF